MKVVAFHLEGSVLTGSVLKDISSTGEDATLGDVFDPWN